MSQEIFSSGLSKVSSLADKAGTAAEVVGADKLAAKAGKVRQGVSQVTKGIAAGEDVISRVQRITANQPIQSKSLSKNNTSLATPALPTILSDISNINPSGLQFTLKAGALPANTFEVVRFDLTESYSEPFDLDVLLSSENADIDFAAVLDNQATLSIWQDGELQRNITGMVSRFEQGDSGFHQTFYRIKIKPDLWRLSLRRNSRIFQSQSIDGILETLLKEHGIRQYQFILRQPHPSREFCVQYRETDFDFLQRLSAEEGIYYYFEQEGEQNIIVFSDDAETLNNESAVVLPYNLNKNAQLQEKAVTAFSRSEQVRPSHVQLKDYTFKNPSWTAQFSKEANDTENQRAVYEHYDYPGRFKDEGQGKAFTQYRLESLRQDAHLGHGQSNSGQLRAGVLLNLTNHPNAKLNTLWQISKAVHSGEQSQATKQEAGDSGTTLNNRFEFIPRHQTWRPQQLRKPRVEGPQIALVVGPAGEEIYCDNFGRIKLQFLWDRYSQNDAHSSCWIRVTQPWAGKGWGMIAIPRVGQEVVVDFLEGDPDQPIVTGRTYHATNMPPGALPGAKTQMNLMSQTYKGGGYNGIMMDDATDGQKLDLHAQKDMNTKVLNDQSSTIQNNRSVTVVGGNETRTVQSGNLSETVKNNRDIVVESGDQSTVIQSGSLSESVKADRTICVEEGNQSLIVKNGDRNVEVQTGNDSLVVKTGDRSIEVQSGDDSKTVTAGNLYETVAETRATQAKAVQMVGSESIVLNVGAAQLSMTTDAVTISFGDGSGITIKADGVYAVGPEIHLNK